MVKCVVAILALATFSGSFNEARYCLSAEGKLTEHEARTVILEMIRKHPHPNVRRQEPELRSKEAVYKKNGLWIGEWYMNLSEKKFTFVSAFKTHAIQYDGVFKQGKNGAWEAAIVTELEINFPF